MKIKLQHPIQSASGQLITELEMRRGTRGDLKDAHKYSTDAIDQEDFLIARLTGLTLEDITLLDLADNATVMNSFRDMAEGKTDAGTGRNSTGSTAPAAV